MKKIDKIFSEGLNNYERQPRAEAWVKLEARLQKPQSKVLPIWWKYASAASIALLLGTGIYLLNNQKVSEINKGDVLVKTTVPTMKETQTVTPEAKISTIESSPTLSKTVVKRSISDKKYINKTLPPAEVPVFRNEATEDVAIQHGNNTPVVTPLPELKKKAEPNTIILVLENNRPKIEQETIVLNMVEMPSVAANTIDPTEDNNKKQTRLSKIWQQLKRAKNGEDVNWNEVGIKPQKVLARADAKIENALTKGENHEK
jgi:hypothetical protein